MIKEIRQEIKISPELKKKIDWAIKYTSSKGTLQNGAIIMLEPLNVAYVEPHKLIINNNTYLFFNGNDSFFINDYSIKYKISDLCNFLKFEN